MALRKAIIEFHSGQILTGEVYEGEIARADRYGAKAGVYIDSIGEVEVATEGIHLLEPGLTYAQLLAQVAAVAADRVIDALENKSENSTTSSH